jgi:hypothetical protein
VRAETMTETWEPTSPEEQVAAIDVLIRMVHTRDASLITTEVSKIIWGLPESGRMKLASLLVALLRIAVPDHEWCPLLEELLNDRGADSSPVLMN